MPKAKPAGKPSMPRRLIEKLNEADALLQESKHAEALELLQELDKAYPNQPDVLGMMLEASFELQDLRQYEHAIRRLAKQKPRDPDLALSLAGALVANLRPVLALRALEDFLRRWPDDPRGKEVRKQIDALQPMIDEQVHQIDLPEEQAFELLRQHDDLRYQMDHGEFELARLAAEKLLKRYPDYVPAMNNLGLIYAVLGSLDKAIDMARQVLAKDPNNLHARANLARLLFLTGHPEEARAEADRLKDSNPNATDRWSKLAETYAILGDDDAVLDLYQQAKRARELDGMGVNPFFYHLLGVSALRRGKEKDARRFWEKALKISPNFSRTLQNLEDLEKPPAERNGPWAFPMEDWLLGRAVRDLEVLVVRNASTKNPGDLHATIRQFLEKYPEVLFLAPHLLDRGDEAAQAFILTMASLSGMPELVEPVKDFIFGRKASAQLRMRGAQMLADADLLPSGPVKIWVGDEQRDIMLLSFEISSEPQLENISDDAQALAQKAYETVNEDPQRAQALLEKAITLQPDNPSLQFNLAMAIGMQGDTKRAYDMIREIHKQFPDYFFAITTVARLAVAEKDFEQARALLTSLMQRKRLHSSEFVALATAEMDLTLAEKNKDAALSWLEMMEKAVPGHPELEYYQQQLASWRSRKRSQK